MIKRLHLSHVGAVAARTALVTTAIVLVLYVAIAVVVLGIVQHNLTADIDSRLVTALTSVRQTAAGDDHDPHHDNGPPGGGRGYPAPHEQSTTARFGPELLVWTVFSDGAVAPASTTNPALPSDLSGVTSLTSGTIDGTDMRLDGIDIGNNRVVVAQSMAGVYATRAQLISAELIVGPVLLAIVFLGALAIGRRVGRPIELARQRQMEFTADASHELRTPLSVIEAQTHLALSQPRDPAWFRQAFQRVDVESTRIRRLVEDLLWLARFDATKASSRSEPVDLGALARGAADRFGAVAETRGLTLTVTLAPGDPPVVSAPPEWLDRLLGVLLDNACKYSPEGGAVRVHAGAEGSRARLVVEDTGPGIPVSERARIFDRFHRATDAPGGAGLGLAIADAVVRSSGGRWEIGDTASGGASMAVSWPRGLAASRGGAAAPARPLTSP